MEKILVSWRSRLSWAPYPILGNSNASWQKMCKEILYIKLPATPSYRFVWFVNTRKWLGVDGFSSVSLRFRFGFAHLWKEANMLVNIIFTNGWTWWRPYDLWTWVNMVFTRFAPDLLLYLLHLYPFVNLSKSIFSSTVLLLYSCFFRGTAITQVFSLYPRFASYCECYISGYFTA